MKQLAAPALMLATLLILGCDDDDSTATTILVPTVIQETEDDATAKLEEAGFEVDTREAVSAQPVGAVVEQDPRAGESAVEGSTVTISVSSGLPPEAEQPQADEPSGVDVVATCADLTGQDVTSTGAPVKGFVSCLKRLDAPPNVIEAWGG